MRLSSATSLALLLGLSLAGCAAGSSDEPRLATEPTLHVAERALASNNPGLAIQVTDILLRRRPHDIDTLTTRGDAQFAAGQPAMAAATFERALKYDPSSINAAIGLGRVRLQTDPAAAETLFLRALEEQPRNVKALNDLGIACDMQKRHADAQAYYRRALALEPDHSSSMVNLGLSLAQSGDKAGALEVLQPLAANGGQSGQVRRNLANALTAAGDPDGAAVVMGTAGGR